MIKVLVIGSINIDLVIKVDRFPNEGETLQGKDLVQLVGGKGANQASAVALQDCDVTLLGMSGNDSFGLFIIEQIKKLGINSQVIQGSQATGTAIIETDIQGKNRIVVIPGANGEFTPTIATKYLSLIKDHDIIVMQFEIPIPTVELFAREAKKQGKTTIINPAPAIPMSDDLLQNTDYLIPNEHELSIITGLPTQDQEQIQTATQILQKKGVANIITTLGEKGVYVSSPQLTTMFSAHPVTPIDTTGAGDAFIGGFAGALAKGLNLASSITHANKVAGISVTKQGAFASAGTFKEVQDNKE